MSSPSSVMVPVDAAALYQVVHAVEGLEQRRLAAAGRADEGGDLVGGHAEVDVLQRMKAAVVEIEVLDYNLIHVPYGTPSCSVTACAEQCFLPRQPDSALMPITMHQQHHGRGVGLAACAAPRSSSAYMCTASVRPDAHDSARRRPLNGAGRKDEGGRLADDAADGQNHAGEDAGHGGRQHDAEHRAQLARAQAEAALAVASPARPSAPPPSCAGSAAGS